MKNLLITGATGKIGSNLLQSLVKSFQSFNFFLITKKSDLKTTNNITIINHDLNEIIPKNIIESKIDVVIHMAAIAHSNDYKSVLETNLRITKNLVDAIKDHNPHFIFFSSVAVYGEANKLFPITVDSPCNPATYYGMSKLMEEDLIIKYFNFFSILRLCPMIDNLENKDLKKRVFIPFTKIIYKSPYKRIYSFSSHKSIFNCIDEILNSLGQRKIINVKDLKDYSENMIINNYSGLKILIPKYILDFIFYSTKHLIKYRIFYKIYCNLWKMFKLNTYV